MLSCHIDIERTLDEVFDCKDCNKCQPKSALNYPFQKDLKDSDDLVNELRVYIEENTMLKCFEPEQHKKPDIRAIDITLNDFLVCRIEAKYLEGKAFVKASEHIGLRAKETLVIDKPKLLHYFECKKDDYKTLNREIPLFVVWKFDRPCNDIGGITVYQEIDKLKDIYENNQNRFFERKSANNDYVNGKKKGITRKFHYSIKETKPFWQMLPEIFEIAKKNDIWKIPNERGERKQERKNDKENRQQNICINCNKPFTPKYPTAPSCYACWTKIEKTN